MSLANSPQTGRNWTKNQLEFMRWKASPKDAREWPNQTKLAEALGVSRTTLMRWSKLEGFEDGVLELVRAGLRASMPALYGALIAQAEAGSYQHLRLAFEMAGEFTQKSETTQLVQFAPLENALDMVYGEVDTTLTIGERVEAQEMYEDGK